jgi:hypothetical protein
MRDMLGSSGEAAFVRAIFALLAWAGRVPTEKNMPGKLKIVALSAATLLASAGVTAQAAGALAIGTCNGDGWSYRWPTIAKAESVAMANCTAKGDKCQVVVTMIRECGAFAISGTCGARGWAVARSRASAESAALAQCRSYGGTACALRAWVCD